MYIFVFVVQPELEEGKKGASSTNLIMILEIAFILRGSNNILICKTPYSGNSPICLEMIKSEVLIFGG